MPVHDRHDVLTDLLALHHQLSKHGLSIAELIARLADASLRLDLEFKSPVGASAPPERDRPMHDQGPADV